MHFANQFIYSRERRRFGRQCLFSDRTQPMLSIQPSHKLRLSYILRNPVNRSTQLSDQKAFNYMETENVTFAEHGMYHYEGGWPREVNIHDEEQTQRHRKKIEREDCWGVQVNNLIHTAMGVAAQNSAVNIYQEFFDDLDPEAGNDIRAAFEARQCNIFHDPIMPTRRISTIDWTPNDLRRFMAQHTNLKTNPPMVRHVDALEVGSSNGFYVWDIKNSLRPMVIMDANEPVRKVTYCPKDENFISGGLESGKVCIWDARNDGMPLQICPLESAHREPVSAHCWVHSKSNSEFYTGSFDGSIKYWDGRDLDTPIQELLLDPTPTDEQARERAHGVAVLEFEYTIPVRFIIASDQGHIFIGNRKGMTPTETLLSNFKLFSGPVRTIERNPFFVKNFLIVADWCAKIWSEECKGSPTTLLVKKKNEMLCGTWSTARCSLFVTGDAKGELDFWDLLLHQRKPIFTIKLGMAIKYIKFRSDGEFLAVGLENGDIHIFEMDPAMKHSTNKEKALVMALFEREQHRCKLLEGRVEEIKLKNKTSLWEAEQMQLNEEPGEMMTELDPEDPEQFLQIIESDTEFRDTMKMFKELTHKVDKKRQERQFVMERTDFEMEYLYQQQLEKEAAAAAAATAAKEAAALAERLANEPPPDPHAHKGAHGHGHPHGHGRPSNAGRRTD